MTGGTGHSLPKGEGEVDRETVRHYRVTAAGGEVGTRRARSRRESHLNEAPSIVSFGPSGLSTQHNTGRYLCG
jgi:hypothetical protein